MSKQPLVALIILDGWGIAPAGPGNAVSLAKTPFLDSLFAQYPHGQLLCFGEAVGLPQGQMGNSEVGHLNLGAGRVIYQDITRINRAIRHGELASNQALSRAFNRVKENNSTLHLLGLVSDGGVHSLLEHLYALIRQAVADGLTRIAIHAFLDGRDTPPDSGAGYLRQLQAFLKDYPQARVATVTGRFWAMDRDQRWERVERAWEALVRGQGAKAVDPVEAVLEAYARREFDEFVQPVVIAGPGQEPTAIRDGDAVVFFNFRADRARELTWAFNSPDFEGFDVGDRPSLSDYVCLTQYDEHLKVPVAFPPQDIGQTLAEVVSQAGLTQLHIAETEKYAHVTFFFNGGREEPFPGEDRVLIPSPKEVATYDQKPAMSAPKVTEEVLKRIASGQYDLLIMNYANGDMVGHTGVLPAAIAAMEAVDTCLAKVIPAILRQGGSVLLTADHGNAEQMMDEHGGPYTAHTVANPVPLLFITPQGRAGLRPQGALCDVAPTLLGLLGLGQPAAMTGQTLLTSGES
ncbi:MAG: 2,3-bisphosphoglycerate-independent phosphoglycerate mutase [Desulfarculus sp.]|nr:2,3-bisphosphoglycerate-independent phosphoglycerate mutase [Desulfarculus sp.]